YRHRHTNGMVNCRVKDFVITHQPWKNRQPSCIGRGPGIRALLINCHVPDRGGVSLPGTGPFESAVEFIEPAAVAIQHQDMAVAIIWIWIALDESIWRNRHRAQIRLSPVGDNPDWNLWLGRGVHYLVGNTNRTPGVEACAEVGMQRRAGSDKGDDVIRVWIDRHRRDICVPCVVGGKWNEPIQVRAATGI